MLIKALTHSDCSYFEEYYRRTGMRQKAINLDQAKMKALFPTLAAAENTDSFPAEVWVFASGRPPIADEQVISLSQKNWRLNGLLPGDLVVGPGDVLLCQILGDDAPAWARIPTGAALAVVREGEDGYQWLSEQCAPQGFATLDDDVLLDAGDAGEWPANSPAWSLIDFLTQGLTELVDDVVSGDEGGSISRIGLRSIERTGTTREAVEKLHRVRAAIGLGGETLVDALLETRRELGVIASYQWVSLSHATAPVDFLAEQNHTELGIEVKTTKGLHDGPFYISIAELRAAREASAYEIWRVSAFAFDESQLSGVIRRSDPSTLVAEALEWLTTSPAGVSVPSVEVAPRALDWSEAELAACPTSRVPDEDWMEKIDLAAS